MKLAILDVSSFTALKQIGCANEEIQEWSNISDKNIGSSHDIEETIDVIQVMYTYLLKIASEQTIEKAFLKHEEKLKKYEKNRRIPKIVGWIELK